MIYDGLLNGYWSKRSPVLLNWKKAHRFCRSMGDDWHLPDVYQLASLVKREKSSEGFINSEFSDNDNWYFWSGTPASETFFWTVSFSEGAIFKSYLKRNKIGARCFMKKTDLL